MATRTTAATHSPTEGSFVAFACWGCCSTVLPEADLDFVPTYCPEHGCPLVASASLEVVGAGARYGIRPNTDAIFAADRIQRFAKE